MSVSKATRTLGILAVIIAVAGISFGIFLQGSTGDLHEVLNIGATATKAGAFLIIPIGIMLLWPTLKKVFS